MPTNQPGSRHATYATNLICKTQKPKVGIVDKQLRYNSPVFPFFPITKPVLNNKDYRRFYFSGGGQGEWIHGWWLSNLSFGCVSGLARPEDIAGIQLLWKILDLKKMTVKFPNGRSWKILDPWSVKPNHKTIFNITILMGIWWYHPQSASVMVGRFMAPRPAAHVQRAGCRWPKHPLNLRGRWDACGKSQWFLIYE